jgi:Recombination endonuclease VII
MGRTTPGVVEQRLRTGQKRCGRCKEVKPFEEFHRSKQSRDGRFFYCKPCQSARAKHYYYNGQAEVRKAAHRRRKFGLTNDRFEQMRADQGDACACCGDPFGQRTPHVDHDHATGVVRALLCGWCNPMLGQARDDPRRLAAGIEYLKSFGVHGPPRPG